MKRRTLLLGGLGSAGALVVGWGLWPARSRVGVPGLRAAPGGAVALNGWVRIGSDGAVQLAMPRSEMGQGVHTALAMLVAEELSLSLRDVQLVEAGHDTVYGNVALFTSGLPRQPAEREPGGETPRVRASEWLAGKVARELNINATGGSSSVADAFGPLRQAAANARARLLGAASLQWKQPVEELVCAGGVVSHPSGPSARFGALARAAALTSVSDASPKPRQAWQLIGTAAPRTDSAAKSDGSAVFGIDVRPPDLWFAVVRHCPFIGGSVGPVDDRAALRQPGVERVVRLGSYAGSAEALAVVGRSTWHAQQGAQKLAAEWRGRLAGTLDTNQIMQSLEAAARSGGGTVFHTQGDPAAALTGATRRVEALYRAPYLAHAALEPINCTARVAGGRVELWAPTQVPGMARAIAAQVAGVPEDAVTVHVPYLGGGFGRRLEVDSIAQAVRVALECGGHPVQLLWPREEDFAHDFYRPAGVALLRAALGADGRPLAIDICSAGDAPAPRWVERAFRAQSPALAAALQLGPDKSTSEGLYDLPYAVAHRRIAHVATHSGVPVGLWRAVGHSHNAFFAESFIDELAHAAGADPVAYRLQMLQALPRHAAVLQLAADKSGWGSLLPPGVARGVALHQSFGTIVAQVVEVTFDAPRRDTPGVPPGPPIPRVRRVVCAIDCGTVVNPGIVAQQVESAVIFGLSAALHGRIDIEAGVVKQQNFPDYPLLTLARTPLIETHIVPSEQPPQGVGEPGLPPVAPALANALFALTGQRLRELPLVPAGVSRARLRAN